MRIKVRKGNTCSQMVSYLGQPQISKTKGTSEMGGLALNLVL